MRCALDGQRASIRGRNANQRLIQPIPNPATLNLKRYAKRQEQRNNVLRKRFGVMLPKKNAKCHDRKELVSVQLNSR